MSISVSQFIPPLHSPLVTTSLFSTSVIQFLFCTWAHLHYFFLDSKYKWYHMYLYYSIWLMSLSITVSRSIQFSSVQSLSRVRLFATPWITACQAFLSNTNSRSLPKLMSIESVMPSSHLILCCPLLLLPPIFPSIRGFCSETALRIRWPKYWSFSFNIRPSNEHPGLISFRMEWLDLLAVQGTLKSLLQHHTSKASIFPCSAFFTLKLSHPYMTTGKTIALTRLTFGWQRSIHVAKNGKILLKY